MHGWFAVALTCVQPFVASNGWAAIERTEEAPLSEASDACITCHETATPGIVADWARSRHATVTPSAALAMPEMSRRVSNPDIPDSLSSIVVGCAECHLQRASAHADSYDHNGYLIHTVVTPMDCAACHPSEQGQYAQNLMSNAHVNLTNNDVYQQFMSATNDLVSWRHLELAGTAMDSATNNMSCYFCHGTKVTVDGFAERNTVFGAMTFPKLTGWPNRGVGRMNPDGTMGACTPCHARHQFSIEVARQPYTCSECHKGPDVPAYKIYSVSKHGNIYSSMRSTYDFSAVPWTVGEDFNAPTCAVCHVSLIQNTDGDIVARRTHQMNNRIDTRIFGLIYAHPHPRSPETWHIRNEAGLQLPTNFDGSFVSEALIDEQEQKRRRTEMQTVCRACHSRQWVDGHFRQFDHVNTVTNEQTKTATAIMGTVWQDGLAAGLATADNPFDEAIEKLWIEHWFFYANTVRLATAMAGADYGVFANGRFQLARNIQEMADYYRLLDRTRQTPLKGESPGR
ncbi:MAG: hydroxylamine oxidase [candidate division Zixibacteria bacterium]|nr:hydroxylamine oxidase [candidate division Zixibacteria bacterium]